MFCSFITASFFLKIRVKDEITAKHSTQSGYMQSIVCFDTLLPICRCGLLCSCSEKESPGQVHSQWRHCVLKLSCCAAVSWNVSRQYTKGMCRQQRERGCRRSRSIILPGVINKCLPKLDTVEWDHWWETSNKRGEDQYTIRLFPPFPSMNRWPNISGTMCSSHWCMLWLRISALFSWNRVDWQAIGESHAAWSLTQRNPC